MNAPVGFDHHTHATTVPLDNLDVRLGAQVRWRRRRLTASGAGFETGDGPSRRA